LYCIVPLARDLKTPRLLLLELVDYYAVGLSLPSGGLLFVNETTVVQ
jgi:hypothetical protein